MTNYTLKCVEIFAGLSEEFTQMVVSRKDFPKFMELGNAWNQHWSQKEN